jgi:predicted transcriptional regulator
MLNTIKMEVKPEEIIHAVKKMKKREREDLESIKEAHADYKAGRVKTHEEVFTR